MFLSGKAGPLGASGPQGSKGESGHRGLKGEKGEKGDGTVTVRVRNFVNCYCVVTSRSHQKGFLGNNRVWGNQLTMCSITVSKFIYQNVTKGA